MPWRRALRQPGARGPTSGPPHTTGGPPTRACWLPCGVPYPPRLPAESWGPSDAAGARRAPPPSSRPPRSPSAHARPSPLGWVGVPSLKTRGHQDAGNFVTQKVWGLESGGAYRRPQSHLSPCGLGEAQTGRASPGLRAPRGTGQWRSSRGLHAPGCPLARTLPGDCHRQCCPDAPPTPSASLCVSFK